VGIGGSGRHSIERALAAVAAEGFAVCTSSPGEGHRIGCECLHRGVVELVCGLRHHDHGGLLSSSRIHRTGHCCSRGHAGHAPGQRCGAVPAIGPRPRRPVTASGPAGMPDTSAVHTGSRPAHAHSGAHAGTRGTQTGPWTDASSRCRPANTTSTHPGPHAGPRGTQASSGAHSSP